MTLERSPLWTRSDKRCHYCRVPLTPETATRDHKVPRVNGGGRGTNYVLACYPCNTRKGSMPYDEFKAMPWLRERRRCVRTGQITEAPRFHRHGDGCPCNKCRRRQSARDQTGITDFECKCGSRRGCVCAFWDEVRAQKEAAKRTRDPREVMVANP